MAVKFVVEFHGAKKTPFISGAKQVSMRKFINYCVSLMSGGFRPAGASIKVRNAATAASGTITFSGAAAVNDTVTVNGQALTATQKNATGTATFSSLAADDTVSIAGVTFTAKVTATTATQFALGANDTAAATNLAAKVNAYTAYPLAGVVTATSSSGVVTFRAVTGGTAGNAITLTSSNGTRAAVSGSGTLTGGAAAASNAWDPGNTAATAGESLKNAINASATAKVNVLVATHDGAGVVTVTAPPGELGNRCTLAKSGSNITVTAALTGGSESTPFTFNF